MSRCNERSNFCNWMSAMYNTIMNSNNFRVLFFKYVINPLYFPNINGESHVALLIRCFESILLNSIFFLIFLNTSLPVLRFFISWETANCSYVVLSFIKRTQTRKRHLFPAIWTRQPASKINYCTLFELAFVKHILPFHL